MPEATNSKEDSIDPPAPAMSSGSRAVKQLEPVATDAIQPLEDEKTPTVSSSASSVTLVQDGGTNDGSTTPPSSPSTSTKPATSTSVPKAKPPKRPRGWLSRPPFTVFDNKSWRKKVEKYTYWSDLTLKERLEFRRTFLRTYLSETSKCLPYVRKFFLTIYRISPWRVVMLFALNVLSGLLPALTLHARGNFLMMVGVTTFRL